MVVENALERVEYQSVYVQKKGGLAMPVMKRCVRIIVTVEGIVLRSEEITLVCVQKSVGLGMHVMLRFPTVQHLFRHQHRVPPQLQRQRLLHHHHHRLHPYQPVLQIVMDEVIV